MIDTGYALLSPSSSPWRRHARSGAAAVMAVWIVLVPALGTRSTAWVQAPGDTAAARTLYTKYEYRIPMRDGVRLYTAVYVPRDTTARHPFLIHRTRYGVGSYREQPPTHSTIPPAAGAGDAARGHGSDRHA